MTAEEFMQRLGIISERLGDLGRQVPGIVRRLDRGDAEEQDFLQCLELFMHNATHGYAEVIDGHRKAIETGLRLLQFHKEFPDIDAATAQDIIDGGSEGGNRVKAGMMRLGMDETGALERIRTIRNAWSKSFDCGYSEAVNFKPPEF